MEAVTCTLLGCVFLGITHPTLSSRVGGRLVKDFIEPGSLGVSHFPAAWQGARKNTQLHQLAGLKCKESLGLRLRPNSSVSEWHSQSDTELWENVSENYVHLDPTLRTYFNNVDGWEICQILCLVFCFEKILRHYPCEEVWHLVTSDAWKTARNDKGVSEHVSNVGSLRCQCASFTSAGVSLPSRVGLLLFFWELLAMLMLWVVNSELEYRLNWIWWHL